MKESAAFLIIAVLSGFGYVGYRYVMVPDSEDFTLPRISVATVCNDAATSFDGSSKAVVYLYKKQMRMDTRSSRGGRVLDTHLIAHSDLTTYFWYDGETEGFVTTYPRLLQLDLDVEHIEYVLREMRCRPWWFPDESLFTPPALVNFTEATVSQ